MKRTILTALLSFGLLCGGVASAQSRDDVMKAQQTLKEKGFYKGSVDGMMGPQTRSALRKYQRSEDITATGRFDEATMNKMGVGNTSVGSKFSGAGSEVKDSYGSGGKTIAKGTKEAGKELKDGEITEGAKDFGKGVGKGAVAIGKGTGRAAVGVAKGVKDAFDGSEKKK